MNIGDLILQNFFGLVATVIGGLILAAARSIRISARKTEAHARNTDEKVSKLDLDKVSLTTHNRALEEWQRDMALRVEALAESKSDTLAWQAQFDRRLRAVEQFAEALDAFAHGRGDVPTYTTPIPALQEEPA